MIKDDLKQFLKTTYSYFGYPGKVVDTARFDMWFNEVKHIPDHTLTYIQTCFFTDRDSPPRNFPKYMKDYYRQFLSSNPTRIDRDSIKSVCSECRSTGFLWFKKHDGNTYCARCGKCKNWMMEMNPGTDIDGIPRLMTIFEIEQQGWDLIEIDGGIKK